MDLNLAFDLLRRDVLAPGGDEQILLPVCDLYVLVVVEWLSTKLPLEPSPAAHSLRPGARVRECGAYSLGRGGWV